MKQSHNKLLTPGEHLKGSLGQYHGIVFLFNGESTSSQTSNLGISLLTQVQMRCNAPALTGSLR